MGSGYCIGQHTLYPYTYLVSDQSVHFWERSVKSPIVWISINCYNNVFLIIFPSYILKPCCEMNKGLCCIFSVDFIFVYFNYFGAWILCLTLLWPLLVFMTFTCLLYLSSFIHSTFLCYFLGTFLIKRIGWDFFNVI